jgi:hypothetical protein
VFLEGVKFNTLLKAPLKTVFRLGVLNIVLEALLTSY